MSGKELEEICRNYLFIKVERAQEVARKIEQAFHSHQCEVTENGEIHLFGFNDTKAVNKLLWQNGFEVEEYFMNLMGGVTNE